MNWEAAIRRVPYIQNCRVKSLDRTVAIWLPRQIVWRICQTNPPKRPIGSTLDQKVPGSIPGGAIPSAAVTYVMAAFVFCAREEPASSLVAAALARRAPSRVYISPVTRSFWSRWTVILLALVASLASPGLAVAHGMAHAHGAEAHHTGDHDSEHHDHGLPEHDRSTKHSDHHDQDVPNAVPLPVGAATAAGQEHRHQHDHAHVESVPSGRVDTRDALQPPVISSPAAVVLPLAIHTLPPLTRWDSVALARPAPDTGPPPTLRAPPIC